MVDVSLQSRKKRAGSSTWVWTRCSVTTLGGTETSQERSTSITPAWSVRRPRMCWFPVAVPIIIFFKRCATCVVQQLKDESSEGGGGGWGGDQMVSEERFTPQSHQDHAGGLREEAGAPVDMVNTFKYCRYHQRPGVA